MNHLSNSSFRLLCHIGSVSVTIALLGLWALIAEKQWISPVFLPGPAATCQTAFNIYHLSASKFFHFIGLFRTIFAVLKSVRIVPGFQDVAMVRNTVKQSGSHFCITKDLYPLAE
ncbi:ABC-type nitrate/sulfonate/bicarbonate transport system permease component [Undibacterium sp. GrIS 1.8]